MTYMEFIIGVENNIAKANCNKLNIGEYEEKQKQIYKQIRAEVIEEYKKALLKLIKDEQDTRYGYLSEMDIREVAEQVKKGVKYDRE